MNTPQDRVDIGEGPNRADPASRPVLNRPHEEPARFWELDGANTATGVVKRGRRLSASQLIVPTARGRAGEQRRLTPAPAEDQNILVNDIRDKVGRWRDGGHDGSTTTTRRLLDHWHSDINVPRLFFAELEAAETLIWLAEVNASHDPALAAFRRDLTAVSSEYNDGIERRCVKMATGSGKTVVMAMVIAWQALNASATRRRDDLYTTSFVAITPGHTVRERLAVLNPSHRENVFREMQLVPPSLREALGQVNIRIVNFQAFNARDRLAGTSSDARKLLRRGSEAREIEAPAATVSRVLRGLPTGARSPKVCVLNDEAHHCYLPAEGRRTSEDDDGKAAAVWFSALGALRSAGRLAPVVYDFSATPIFIETGQRRERMFPWVVSDFPLMDAIESGLVKIPQVPVADDSAGGDVEWRNLYDPRDPKRLTRHTLPNRLRRAISALYASYENKYAQWMTPAPPAEPMPTPPVLIVVANSIPNAKAICEYIAGWAEADSAGRTVHHPGECPLFANHTAHGSAPRLRTLLVHSKLEGDDRLSGALKAITADQASWLREAGANTDDRAVVRAALNSVGRSGGVGEHIRCVVSVSMLTEGWDTRTVTHVLGYRAFSTQLLCEQVTGRALRRSNYDAVDDDGLLIPEYAEVIGVPFEFMPSRTGDEHATPPRPRYEVHTVADRAHCRIQWPNVDQYLRDTGTDRFDLAEEDVREWVPTGATSAELTGTAGKTTTISTPGAVRAKRVRTVVAQQLVREWEQRILADESTPHRSRRRILFADAAAIVARWMRIAAVTDAHYGQLATSDAAQAAQQIAAACKPAHPAADRVVCSFAAPTLLNTSAVNFETSLLHPYETEKSELDIAACHTRFEWLAAAALDTNANVVAWARNFRLDWTVPYLWEDRWHRYQPDFVARISPAGAGPPVHLIVECKGQPDDRSDAKHRAVTELWIPAIAADRRLPAELRRWAFTELTDQRMVEADLTAAISTARHSTGDGPDGDH